MRNPTAADIAQLQDRWKASAKASRTGRKVEASIQETCCALLLLDGWRRIKTDLGHLRGMGVQEPGIADDCFIRYGRGADVTIGRDYNTRAIADVLWVEWKAPKTGKTSQVQHDWHALERALGGLTWKAGEDFEATVEGFVEHYNNPTVSGLAIKQMRVGAARR